jgi:UDP-N-acetylglucosamine:LPS N-acetylglucosamine transferase
MFLNLRLVGNQNEGPILENFLKETKKGTTLYKVHNLCRPGLVQKAGAKYCKTTIDAFGPAEIDSEEAELVGVEVKTRTTHRTRQLEIRRRNRRTSGANDIFTMVEATS